MACNPHADGTPMISEMLSSGNCRTCLPPCGDMRVRYFDAFARASSFLIADCPIDPATVVPGGCNSHLSAGGAACTNGRHYLQFELSWGGGACVRAGSGSSFRGTAFFRRINRFTQVIEYSEIIRPGSTTREALVTPFTVAASGVAEFNNGDFSIHTGSGAAFGGPDVIGADEYDPTEAASRALDYLNAGRSLRPDLQVLLPENRPSDTVPVERWWCWRDNSGTARITDVTVNRGDVPAYLGTTFVQPVMTNEIVRSSGTFIDWTAIVVDPLPGEGIIVSAAACDETGIYPPACREAVFFNRSNLLPLQVDSSVKSGIVWIKGNWCLRRFLL